MPDSADYDVRGQYPVPAEYGDRVRFRRKGRPHISAREGEGTFVLAWLGIEECWEVETDDGERIALYPCLRDEVEPVTHAR